MTALGQHLLAQRWIDEDQLDDALLHQQETGGRLGTSLLEKGYISEERLLAALAAQQGAPAAGSAELGGIAPEVAALLAPNLASRHLAIPFRLVGTRLDVALARTDDLAQLDELSFVLGKRLRPHVALEARLFSALETYYQVPCPRRFRLLVERMDRTPPGQPPATGPRRLEDLGSGAPRSPKVATSGPGRFVRAPEPPARRSIPLTDAQRRALAPTVSTSEPPLSEQLARAESPEAVARALLGALDEHFLRSLLFRVARGSVSGWLGHGPGIDRDWLAGYSVGLRQATVFRQVEQDGFFRGRLAPGPAHDSLARCWDGELGNECLLRPVRVRDRTVCFLYGDRGPLGLGGLNEEEVERLAAKAGLAFERLILDRKLRG